MEANLKIDKSDLKLLWFYTKGAYNNITFDYWCKESLKSYQSYFNNKELFKNRRYTYSQFVNAQILAII